jgi:Ca2+-binding RTX toxin-like protein
MAVSFFDVDGRVVDLLITNVTGRIRLSGGSVDRFFKANFDSDSDGTDDSVLATFTFSEGGSGGRYGIFLTDEAGSPSFIARVDDFSSVTRPIRYNGSNVDVPYIYLGSSFRDKVSAGGLDSVYGNDGSDILRSDGDGTELFGGAGNDQLIGGIGRDTLVGESGRDTMTGGGGADVFVFDAAALDKRDIVTDFSQAENDRVDLSAIAGLDFVAAFSGTGPEVRERQLADRTALIFDLDGNGIEDARITFFGAIDFARGDLILPA